MADISDKVSLRLHTGTRQHQDIVKLRYASDYGHGFLGLFRALFDGNLEEVIRDPGPPFVDEKHIPLIRRNLIAIALGTVHRNKIPKKYAHIVKSIESFKPSEDSLFEK